MKYYKNLYLSKELKEEKKSPFFPLHKNNSYGSMYLIILSHNTKNNLEILTYEQLLNQAFYPVEDIFIVGIVKSYEEALEVVEKIASEVYDKTRTADIRSYILNQEQEA